MHSGVCVSAWNSHVCVYVVCLHACNCEYNIMCVCMCVLVLVCMYTYVCAVFSRAVCTCSPVFMLICVCDDYVYADQVWGRRMGASKQL